MRNSTSGINEVTRDAGLLGIRGMLATVFLFHGSQKMFGWFDGPGIAGFSGYLESMGFPLPVLNAWMAAGAEVFGGVALLLLGGWAFRLAMVPLAFTMLVAAFVAHWGAFDARAGGMEYALTLAVVVASLALTGAGRFTAVELPVPAFAASLSGATEGKHAAA